MIENNKQTEECKTHNSTTCSLVLKRTPLIKSLILLLAQALFYRLKMHAGLKSPFQTSSWPCWRTFHLLTQADNFRASFSKLKSLQTYIVQELRNLLSRQSCSKLVWDGRAEVPVLIRLDNSQFLNTNLCILYATAYTWRSETTFRSQSSLCTICISGI